jgi:hypothetical protein
VGPFLLAIRSHRAPLIAVSLFSAAASSLGAQVDRALAETYFQEAAALCAREGGHMWGVSLCGPMVFADAATHTIATSQPAPTAPQPALLGFANAAIDWGGTRWSTFVWQLIPTDDAHGRARLMLHELFHRIQPQIGFAARTASNDHLDTPDGRYWMQLEWRALAKALGSLGRVRLTALQDALAFRQARRNEFPGAAENERLLEMNEGLAQYTGTMASVTSSAAAAADAIDQLRRAPSNETFVRTFAYPLGAAYGVMLETWSPGWTHRAKPTDDLGQLVMAAARAQPTADPEAAATRYGGPEIRIAETQHEAERQARIADLRRRFVDGPVVTTPGIRTSSSASAGFTPIPGIGTVMPGFHTTAEWGTLEAANVLVAPDRSALTLPAPATVTGTTLNGDGWTLTIANGWSVRPGMRAGDLRLVRDTAVPVANEPRHHDRIANEYVRVYDVVVPPADTTLYHLHAVDYTYVSFGAANLVAQVLGSDPAPLILRDGEVRFTRGPIAHRVSNTGLTPFHNVTIELLPHDSAAPPGLPTPNVLGDSVMLDNDRVRVVRRTLLPGKTADLGSRVLGVYLSAGRVQLVVDRKRGEQLDVQPATFAWFGEPGTHGVRNVGKQPLTLLMFFVK